MGEKRKTIHLDGLHRKDKRLNFFDLPLAKFVQNHKNSSVLFAKNGRTEFFYTQDSKLYITPAEYRKIERG